MCVVCGCSDTAAQPPRLTQVQDVSGRMLTPGHDAPSPDERHAHSHEHPHVHPHEHPHAHPHEHPDPAPVASAAGLLHFGQGGAGATLPGISQRRTIALEANVLGANDRVAEVNRQRLAQAGILALNFVSSPGSGKTSLLVETIRRLAGRIPVSVVEGDQQTTIDAQRIRAAGAAAIQVNTGHGCHLDAPMLARSLDALAPEADSLLLIENVGNLVCPALWDLGEAAKIVVLSVTEGDDKPLKYPDMFAASRLMLLTKQDLLAHVRFDTDRAIENARRVRPDIEVIILSAETGAGMDAWLDWIDNARATRAALTLAEENRGLRVRLAAAEQRLADLAAQAGP